MSRTRSLKLLNEIDAKLARYAELHGLKVEVDEVIAEAVERFLAERAAIRMRIAEARRAHEEAHGRG